MNKNLYSNLAKTHVLLFFSLTVFLALTVYGLVENKLFFQDYPLWFPEGWYALYRLFAFSAIAVITFYKFRFNFLLGSLLLIIAYLFSVVGFAPVAAIALLLLGSYGLGDWLLDKLAERRKESENYWKMAVLSFVVGFAIIVAIMQYLIHFPVNHPGLYIVLLLLTVLTRFGSISELFGRIASFNSAKESEENATLKIFSGCLLFTSVALHVIFVAKPEVDYDALSMHLHISAYIAEHSYWHFDVLQGIWAVMPMGGDIAFSLAYLVGGEFAARLINLIFLGVTCTFLYHASAPRVGPLLSRVFLAAYLSTPLFGALSGTLFVEHFLTMLIFSAGITAFSKHISFRNRWIITAVFLSVALATKIMAIFCFPVFFVVYLWQLRNEDQSRRAAWFSFISILSILIIVASVPYLYALYKTGNPVFPFLNHIFKSPYFNSDQPFDNPKYSQGFSAIKLIYDLTFHTERFLGTKSGGFGFLWLVFLVPSLLALKKKSEPIIWFSAVFVLCYVGFIFSQLAYLRYIAPALPFAALLIINLIHSMLKIRLYKSILYWVLAAVCSLNIIFFSTASWFHTALFAKNFDLYIARYAPERHLVQYLNIFAPAKTVLFIGRFYPTGLKGEAYGDNWYFPLTSRELRGISAGRLSLVNTMKKLNAEYLITSDSELTRRPIIKEKIGRYFDEIVRVKGYFLARMRSDAYFTEELLSNNDFNLGSESWLGNADINKELGRVMITKSQILTQSVKVEGGVKYLIEYQVNCPSSATMRLQVNWLDDQGVFIGTSLYPQDCRGENQTFTREVVSPPNAKIGNFYVALHDGPAIEVLHVSMKK